MLLGRIRGCVAVRDLGGAYIGLALASLAAAAWSEQSVQEQDALSLPCERSREEDGSSFARRSRFVAWLPKVHFSYSFKPGRAKPSESIVVPGAFTDDTQLLDDEDQWAAINGRDPLDAVDYVTNIVEKHAFMVTLRWDLDRLAFGQYEVKAHAIARERTSMRRLREQKQIVLYDRYKGLLAAQNSADETQPRLERLRQLEVMEAQLALSCN
jgi:hypothetical protein